MQTNESAEQEALTAAEGWVVLIDEGDFTESWNQAASLFKSAVSLDQWQTALKTSRMPFGKVVSRSLKSKQYAKELPGAPDGEYVVIQYETAFEQKQNSVETITPMKDKNGEWRVSGYYIK